VNNEHHTPESVVERLAEFEKLLDALEDAVACESATGFNKVPARRAAVLSWVRDALEGKK
jgi:hypothetical protein